MKKLLLFLSAVSIAVSAFAGEPVGFRAYEKDDYQVYREEAAAILETKENYPVGDFTLTEMRSLALDLSIPFQKIQYVKDSKTASAVFPGMGQYMNNDPQNGTLFMLSHITVVAGTLIGAYYMLPDELQFDKLNYISDSYFTINERWENQSIKDMLPSMGILAGGFVVNSIIRYLSSAHAGKLAQKNITEGKIKFEPKIILPVFGFSEENGKHHSEFGFGMGMGF
jgi:hypothetical protein